MELPGWLAVIEQVPAVTIVTVEPDTVQTALVFDAKVTGSPELAVAVSVNGATPSVTVVSGPKVIVCDPWLTVKLLVTGVAAA